MAATYAAAVAEGGLSEAAQIAAITGHGAGTRVELIVRVAGMVARMPLSGAIVTPYTPAGDRPAVAGQLQLASTQVGAAPAIVTFPIPAPEGVVFSAAFTPAVNGLLGLVAPVGEALPDLRYPISLAPLYAVQDDGLFALSLQQVAGNIAPASAFNGGRFSLALGSTAAEQAEHRMLFALLACARLMRARPALRADAQMAAVMAPLTAHLDQALAAKDRDGKFRKGNADAYSEAFDRMRGTAPTAGGYVEPMAAGRLAAQKKQ